MKTSHLIFVFNDHDGDKYLFPESVHGKKARFAHMMSQTAHQCSSALGWLEDIKYFPREIPGFSGVPAVISASWCCPVNWAAANEWHDWKGMKHSVRKYILRWIDIDLEVVYNHWSLPCSDTITSLPAKGHYTTSFFWTGIQAEELWYPPRYTDLTNTTGMMPCDGQPLSQL